MQTLWSDHIRAAAGVPTRNCLYGMACKRADRALNWSHVCFLLTGGSKLPGVTASVARGVMSHISVGSSPEQQIETQRDHVTITGDQHELRDHTHSHRR
jgi:hypothetical protein